MAPDHGSKVDISFAGRFTASAIAACFAEITTIPLDTAKVRLQLQKKAVAGDLAAPKYRGLLGTATTIAREEGAAALWKGIVPGLHRQCIYGGLRIGLYEPVRSPNPFSMRCILSKSLVVRNKEIDWIVCCAWRPSGQILLCWGKPCWGCTFVQEGALAIAVANPTDLVKVRLQSEGKLAPGVPRRYTGAMNAYATIVRQEGFAALWTGIGPNVARNAIINAAELASYDQVKQSILKLPGFKDDVVTHILSGLGAGFFAVCVGSPVDVVKSRMMGDSAYKSTIDCFVKTLKNDDKERRGMESEAAAAQGEGDLLHAFERILHDDPLIDEVGFLHPTQFHSLLVDSTNKSTSQHFWCSEHKLAISTSVLPDLYRAAHHAHSDATLNSPSSSPSAVAAAALIMTHSKALVILCPDLLTAWNSRKRVLSTNYDLKQLKDELQLCALILSYSPKNESTWSHRRWVITKLAQHLLDMSELIDNESLLVKQIAEKSKMNYRAWRHRCWLIPFMNANHVLDELNKSTKWSELHVADNCCFHYRRSLLLALLDSRGAENGKDPLNWQSEAHLMWKEELRWNEMLIRRYQGRESLWIHRRFLSQWWLQQLLSCEETCPSKEESLADLFLAQEIHLLSDCLSAPGDEFGETRIQAGLAALYILWISKQDAVVKGKVEEGLRSVGSLKEVLARASPEKSRLWTQLLHC